MKEPIKLPEYLIYRKTIELSCDKWNAILALLREWGHDPEQYVVKPDSMEYCYWATPKE